MLRLAGIYFLNSLKLNYFRLGDRRAKMWGFAALMVFVAASCLYTAGQYAYAIASAGLSSLVMPLFMSAASLVTGVFIVERIYNFWGVSNFIRNALEGYPDIPAAVGFAVFAVLMVLVFMLVFDLLKVALDPRHRAEIGQE